MRSSKIDKPSPWDIPAENDPFCFEHIRKLKLQDPFFDEVTFLGYAKNVFEQMQLAIKTGDKKTVRAFLSDRQFDCLSNFIQYGEPSDMFSVDRAIIQSNIFDVSFDKSFECIHTIMTLQETSNKRTRERWTFIRSVNAKTLVDKGVNADKCPNCGASLSVNASGECDYCHSNITKGDFDWVLSEITQLN